MKTKFPILVLLLCSLGIARSPGYVLEGYSWTKNRTVLMHLSLPTGTRAPFQDGSPSLNAVAEDALNTWNQYLVHMKFAVNRGSILPAADGDGNTSVTLSDTLYGKSFGAGVIAVTLTNSRGPLMVEADVVFNNEWDYDSYRGHLQADGLIDFRRVALHEFGHVLGLDHPDQASPKQTVSAIMNSTVSGTYELQPDDINGAKSIYDSGPAFLIPNPSSNLVNLSTRAFVGTGNDVVIGGFIIKGTQPTTVILRGIGNSLPALGITNPLEDPEIELHSSGGGTIATSDDWVGDSWATTIASYRVDPTNSRESAILATLSPGSYTVVLHSFDNGDGKLTGTGLIELFDLHTGNARAGNISTRGPVLADDQVLIGGFIVGGSQPKDVVVRAMGPSLTSLGVPGALPDPTVELRNASGALVSSNDNWGDGPNAAQIQSENLAPNNPAESALQASLAPGSYTAVVRGAGGTTGIGLVEIYDLSPGP